MGEFNFKLEAFADPGWNLEFQRISTVSNEIKTNAQIYSGDPDLFKLVSKARDNLSDLDSLNLEKIRDWYLLLSEDEEWFHKETFELVCWDGNCSSYINLDYVFDDYEQEYDIPLSKLVKILKSMKTRTKMELNGELGIRIEGKDIIEIVRNLNEIISIFPPKKTELNLDKNWSLFRERVDKVLASIPVKMQQLENEFSFNKLSFMSILSSTIDQLQKRAGKEPIVVEFSTMLTSLKSNPSVGDDLNSQLAYLNRFLNLQLLDWDKFSIQS